ncbi:sensor histidine kinase [Noviherbaspirillum suwonense]|jgi:signal transduction histidine kinase|uniref:histidine kinase n=1 Tax=Noviherbaspirillum suwonense TaxID=1224511 RepID=A0ABY1QE67_9BURK|nr:ATP-binding protein [Noviherbaspirillum suwonense]SMP67135.1 Signal transduction histidine kinase [Noviherbaspirillum suwonense]
MKIKPFSQQSLWCQFLLASFPIFLISTLLIGTWVSKKIENSVAYRLGGVTALYVESFIGNYLQSAARGGDLTEQDRAALQSILKGTPLGKKIVAFKVWNREGKILYSPNASLIGKSFPIEDGLAEAYAGNIHSEISQLSHKEHATEQARWDRLIETYVPIRTPGDERIIAVAEFYQTTEELSREASMAQLQSWVIVAATFLAIYLLLLGLVRQGSDTITRQRSELERQIGTLMELNEQNQMLNDRVRRAAARATSLNENFLRRISSDLHDGPGQDLGFALMQIDTIIARCMACPGREQAHNFGAGDFHTLSQSLRSAMAELRTISAGLCLPDITNLPLPDVVERAVRDYEGKSGAMVKVAVSPGMDGPESGSEPELEPESILPVKITLYRVLQESLANGFRHAGGIGQSVSMVQADGRIHLRVNDAGKGFFPQDDRDAKHLGLKGMRGRVEILGGTFQISSSDSGTVIHVTLPLTVPGMNYA